MCMIIIDANKETLNVSKSNLQSVFPQEEIVSFISPLEALKYADHHVVDYIFTDVRLKPIDGYELIKAIRKKYCCLAYVVSGSTDRPDDLKWMAVNGCFTKPISVEALNELKKEFEIRV